MFSAHYDSPVGPLMLTSDGDALTGLSFGAAPSPDDDLPLFETARAWLDGYFAGRDPGPTPPLRPAGTDFQQRVWRELSAIPFGRTTSYGAVARAVGCPSPRAVGQAIHGNPIALMIPCHRVVGADGRLTGFAGGLEVKRRLLALEGSLPSGQRDR